MSGLFYLSAFLPALLSTFLAITLVSFLIFFLDATVFAATFLVDAFDGNFFLLDFTFFSISSASNTSCEIKPAALAIAILASTRFSFGSASSNSRIASRTALAASCCQLFQFSRRLSSHLCQRLRSCCRHSGKIQAKASMQIKSSSCFSYSFPRCGETLV
jgi:hypothetical protein